MVSSIVYQSMAGDSAYVHDNFHYLDLLDRFSQRTRYFTRVGGCQSRAATSDGTTAENLRAYTVVIARFLYGRPDGRAHATGTFRDYFSSALDYTGAAHAVDRRNCAGHRHRLSTRAQLADDTGTLHSSSCHSADVPFHR